MKKYLSVIPVWTLAGILFSFPRTEYFGDYQVILKLTLLFCIVAEDFIKRIVFFAKAEVEKYKAGIIAPLAVVLQAVYNLLLRRQIAFLGNEALLLGIAGMILLVYLLVIFPREYIKKK
jgi:hypothetical protein